MRQRHPRTDHQRQRGKDGPECGGQYGDTGASSPPRGRLSGPGSAEVRPDGEHQDRQHGQHEEQRPDEPQVAPYGTRAIASPPITTAKVGMTRFTSPDAVWYAVTTSSGRTSAKLAPAAP